MDLDGIESPMCFRNVQTELLVLVSITTEVETDVVPQIASQIAGCIVATDTKGLTTTQTGSPPVDIASYRDARAISTSL